MQTIRMVQAVILMLIVATAASCASSKEYTSKLFSPRVPHAKDTQTVAKTIQFLDFDTTSVDKEDWVSTDIIMGRDTVSKTLALDKLAKIYPAVTTVTDTISRNGEIKPVTVLAVAKPLPVESEPVAKNANSGEVRNKRTREK